jgi:CheY-like chemotaxis protein
VTASGGATALPPREVWLAGQSEARLAEWRILPILDSAGRLVRIDSALLDVTAWHSARQAAQANRAELEHAAQKLQLQLRELLDQSFELAEARTSLKRAGEARMEALLNWGRRVAQPLGDAAAISARLRSQGSAPLSPGEITALVEAVDSVSASLRALADFAGLERGPLQLTPAAFSPRALVEDAVSDIAERAEAANLELPCFVHQNVPAEVVADTHRLREALGHVLEHSIAHTSCGEVSVRLTLGGRAGSLAHLRLEVEDTGAGYSPDDLAAAFEPFHPGLAPTEVASRLAFAKRLLERMGGHFGAESEPGQGTRVWLSVPTGASAGEENGNRIQEMPALKDRHILIVDDAASQRGALVEMAETLGLRAKACASVEEAAPLLRSAAVAGSPFSFVLVDDEVPGIRSKAIVSSIASDAAVEDTQVFMMVPYSMRAMCTAPAPAGIQGIVAKPVRLRALALALTGGRPVEWGVSAQAAPLVPPRAASGSPCVLIVEDNLVNQRVAVRLVEKMGYRAAVVSNGREAVQSFQREHYDLILMDCQMPEVDGFTATAEIRRMEASGSRMPIIAMTANAMRGDREKCIAAGMDDYISKPVAFEDLRKLVTRWLARAEVARL